MRMRRRASMGLLTRSQRTSCAVRRPCRDGAAPWAVVLTLVVLAPWACAHQAPPPETALQPPPVASELAPWQGEVRVSNFNALGGESGDELEEIAVEVIKGLLAQVGVPVEVECLKLAGRHRRQLHVELYVTFPEGGKPEEREAVVELMAGLAPTASAFQ